MDELAALASQGAASTNPMSAALDGIKQLTGGNAGPSSATQGTYAGSLTLNAGVNMGNGIDTNTILYAVAIMAVAYVVIKRK
ncbi:hypothetical protein [Vibrio viridaestus]|uniref:Uncharacterized protein n=1 Tax=Vibrio viridaestus TaxID=2487322 RepID=A0A3N9TAV2_9VIBR|nr:hypothetical protein [Vibrio viridaestus]RQW61030.1 hypothetical protein EES38_21515 [Vibrio viridaestus]